jgi:hypothetical protein
MEVKDLKRKLEVVVMGCIREGGCTTTCEIVRQLQRIFFVCSAFGLRVSDFRLRGSGGFGSYFTL